MGNRAVAVVTAGRSSWTKINAVGEMIRLAGTRLVSAVLVGADKTDDSLGVVPGRAGHACASPERVSHPDAGGLLHHSRRGRGKGELRQVIFALSSPEAASVQEAARSMRAST